MKTIKLNLMLLFIVASFQMLNAQSITQIPFVEVTGVGDTAIVPNEIFITIRLKDNNKVSIEKQEENLKQKVKELGIELKNLTVLDVFSDYSRISLFQKAVVTEKKYLLKVGALDSVKSVFNSLKTLNVDEAFISKTSHSQLRQIWKDVRIKAIQNAKEKAEYMVQALGQQIGSAVEMVEKDMLLSLYNSDFNPYRGNVYSTSAYLAGDSSSEEIEFNKIKLTGKVVVKFALR